MGDIELILADARQVELPPWVEKDLLPPIP